MPLFIYKARDKDGELITAELEAESDVSAAMSIKSLGFSIVSIKKQKPGIKNILTDLSQKLRASHKTELVFVSKPRAKGA